MNVLITLPSLMDHGGIATYYNAVLPFLEDQNDFRISYLEIGSTKNSLKFLHPLIDQIRFYNCISKNSFDLIHVNPSLYIKSFFRDGMIIYLAKRKGLPVIVFFHGWGVFFERHLETKLWWFFKKTYRLVDRFIVLSSDFKEKLRKWQVSVPISVGVTAVDEKLLSGFCMKKKVHSFINASKIKILFLSRIEKYKGIFETLEAISILLERGHDVSLSIAGDGSSMKSVLEYIERHNLYSDRVTLLGYVRAEEKATVLGSHHIYCLPSYGEGMPCSILEAMAFGMPIITTPVGGIKYLFENGKMGYFVEKNDPEVIANLIECLIIDKGRMIDIGLYNHSYAKENFLGSKLAKNLIEIYREILQLTGKASK